MYGQAMELLVLKVMLALGEGEAALERVRADKHLEGRVRQVSYLALTLPFCIYHQIKLYLLSLTHHLLIRTHKHTHTYTHRLSLTPATLQ